MAEFELCVFILYQKSVDRLCDGVTGEWSVLFGIEMKKKKCQGNFGTCYILFIVPFTCVSRRLGSSAVSTLFVC